MGEMHAMKTWGDALAALRAAIADRDWDRGERILETMQESAERSAEPSQLASLAFQRGLFEDARGALAAAEAAFSEAVSWDLRAAGEDSHAVADALRSLGIVRARAKKTDLAVTTFEQASRAYVAQRSSDAIETMWRAGRALEDAGRFDDAIARYTRAEGLLPDIDTPAFRTERLWALFGHGECLRRTKQYAASRERSVRATWLATPPRTPALELALANAWFAIATYARHVLRDEVQVGIALAAARTICPDPRVRDKVKQELAGASAPERIEGWVVLALHPEQGGAEVVNVEAGLRLAKGRTEGLTQGRRVEVALDASGYRLVAP